KMVTEFGMSKEIGTIYLGSDSEVFVGRELGHSKSYSEEIAAKIDKEIDSILSACYAQAKKILTDHFDKLKAVSDALVQNLTLPRAEFVAIMDGESNSENNEEVLP
ncbi:MAG: cell division protein FtsH, partial [Eubacteriales bacterium]|nr:cell division protein FtsH [Eubacteriales bacterium]